MKPLKTRTHPWMSLIGLVTGLVLTACVLDSLVVIVRTPKHEIRLYPGMRTMVAGKTERPFLNCAGSLMKPPLQAFPCTF